MTPTRKKLLIAGILLGTIAAILVFTRNTEPRYDGHPLSYWVTTHRDPTETINSHEAIRHIGTNAIPYLLKWISERPSGSKTAAIIDTPIRWLNKKVNPTADWSIGDSFASLRYGSVRAFGALGSQAESVIPALRRILNESPYESSRILAAHSLRHLEKSGILAFTGALTNSDAMVRREAATMIAILEPETELNIPVLIHALDDTDPHIKQTAYQSLGDRVHDPSVMIPLMIRRLDHDTPTGRICVDESDGFRP